MKKFFKAAIAAIAVVILACAFVGCSDASGKIQKAFEREGYTVTAVKAEDSPELQNYLSDEQKKDINKYGVLNCTKRDGLNSAVVVIIKYPSKDEIIEGIGQENYDSAVENGLVNGNCYLAVPGSLNPSKVIEIFKNA